METGWQRRQKLAKIYESSAQSGEREWEISHGKRSDRRGYAAIKVLPKKAPATVVIIKPFTVVVSIRILPIADNSNEKVAFTAIELTIIDKKAVSGSRTARKNAVNNATSSNSNMEILYYVIGCA